MKRRWLGRLIHEEKGRGETHEEKGRGETHDEKVRRRREKGLMWRRETHEEGKLVRRRGDSREEEGILMQGEKERGDAQQERNNHTVRRGIYLSRLRGMRNRIEMKKGVYSIDENNYVDYMH